MQISWNNTESLDTSRIFLYLKPREKNWYRYCYGGTIYNIFISKGFGKYKQVKISDMKEHCLGDIVTPFSSSKSKKINCQKIRSRLTYFIYLFEFELGNGVTMSPKRCSLISLIFTYLRFTTTLLLWRHQLRDQDTWNFQTAEKDLFTSIN